MKIQFTKMDGIGNDFIIIDNRSYEISFTKSDIIDISDRNNTLTKGCDQFLLIENSKSADCFMRIYNADGGEVNACGNASRCIGWLIARETNKNIVHIETSSGILLCSKGICDNDMEVNMGVPKYDWSDIPLSHEMDTLNLDIFFGKLSSPTAVSIGNPHAVFFVDYDIANVNLKEVGEYVQNLSIFPESVNVGIANINCDDCVIKLRVYERGVGETLACGTGACASVIAASRKGFVNRRATVELKGGNLNIEWLDNGNILMTGAVNFQFDGVL